MTLSTNILRTRESFSVAPEKELQNIVRNVREVLANDVRRGSMAWCFGICVIAIARRELKMRAK